MGAVEDGARKTADGAAVVEQTREAFMEIGAAVDDIAARVEQIAASAEQVTASAASMQETISQVAAVAQESSASTEQVSASTEETSASTEQVAASAAEMADNADSLRRPRCAFPAQSRPTARSLDETFCGPRARPTRPGTRGSARRSGPVRRRCRRAGQPTTAARPAVAPLDTPVPQRPRCVLAGAPRSPRAVPPQRGAVLDLATSGRGAEAEQRMHAEDFTGVERRLKSTLQTAIATAGAAV